MDFNEAILKEEFFKLKREISAQIELIDLTQKSHLQKYLYFVYYPLFSLAESIIILCDNGKDHSAKILLRSLIEAHINIIYHQVADSEYRLSLSAKGGFDIKAKNIKGLKDLIRRYPNLRSTDPTKLFSEKWLDNAGEWVDIERQAILKGNSLKETDQELDLLSKAIKCDEAHIKNAESGHFQRMYHIIFRQLSPTAHLNIEGIQTFVDEKEAGKYLFTDSDDRNLLISEAIDICVALTKDLYECGVLEGNIPDTADKIEKLIVR